MSGVWFIVSIPTEVYERKLKNRGPQPKDTLAENNRKNQPNGFVSIDIHNEKEFEKNIIPTSPKAKKKDTKNDEDDEKSLEWHLKDCLDKLAIYDDVWVLSKQDTFYHVSFPCEGPGVECDFVLQSLQNRGIGISGLSTVGCMPCDVFYRDYGVEEEMNKEETEDDNDEAEKRGKGFKAMQKEFLKSVTARLTVAQVVEKVRGDAALSFDFIMFVILASSIAALGLSENSPITIVAAMLVSPIMGPIMAFTFGLTIRDKKLIKLSMRTEVIGLLICLLCGFIFGFVCGNFSETWGAGKWPTPEMSGRGNKRSLWAGALIALPSGAGVALSILRGNGASLVGVAISASLLPPTVNCGLLWGLAAIKTVRGLYQHHVVVYDIYNHTVKPALLPPDDYTPMYYPLMDKECAVLGIISFLLTVINIFCIIISSLLILKIKEVAPNTTESAVSRFWKHDVKIARDYNKTLGNNDGEELGKQFLQEWANLNGIDPETVLKPDNSESQLTQLQTLMEIVEDAQEDSVFKSIAMSNPAPADKMTRRLSVLPPGLGEDLDADIGIPRLRRASVTANKQMLKKRRQSRVVMEALAEDEEAPRVTNLPRKSRDHAFPSKMNGSRFNVSPVDEEAPPASVLRAAQRRRRNSCFPTNNPNLGVTKTGSNDAETTNF